MKGGDSKSFGEEVGNLVVLVSRSERPTNGGLMEADAVGSNNLNLQN
jgi:hypothetical protein